MIRTRGRWSRADSREAIALAAVLAGEVAGPKVGEQERILETYNPIGSAASKGTKNQDLEVID